MSGTTYRIRQLCVLESFVPDGSYFHTGTWKREGVGQRTLYVKGVERNEPEDSAAFECTVPDDSAAFECTVPDDSSRHV